MKKADPSERTGCSEGPPLPTKFDTRDENPLLARLLTCRNTSMAQLAHLLFKGMASGYVGGPVFDTTGLEGGWDFTLSFSSAGQLQGAAQDGRIALQCSIRTADRIRGIAGKAVPVLQGRRQDSQSRGTAGATRRIGRKYDIIAGIR